MVIHKNEKFYNYNCTELPIEINYMPANKTGYR